MLDSIFNLISFLSLFGEKINGSSLMVLYSTLLSNSMYLFKALISSEWKDIADVLLAHPEVDDFIIAAFNAVCVNVNLLQATLTTQRINNCLFHLCESSLQFLLSLCKLQILFQERLVQNKELCGGGAIFRLVENTLKLSQYDDPKLSSVVNRLKSKVLSIVLLLFQAECSSFMDMASTQSKGSAESAVSEVLEVLKMMCFGDLKGHHPRGLLLLNAMKVTEIFCGASRFRTFMVLNLKKVLTRVFLQPQREFISTWCTYDHEPAEEEIVVDFNPTSAAGLVLGLNSSFNVQHSTWSNFQAPRTPYRVQRSSLLIKIVANLACYDPDLSEDENACFIDAFLECLQAEFSNLPGGAAERRAAASKNLSSLLAYAESLAPSYLHEEDVNILRWFINQLEKPPTAQESSSRGVMAEDVETEEKREKRKRKSVERVEKIKRMRTTEKEETRKMERTTRRKEMQTNVQLIDEGTNGEFRVPMISQYGNTPSLSGASDEDFELVRSNLLDNHCVYKINNTLTESCVMFPEKTPETRFNDLGIQAVNLSTRLDNVWTDEDRSEVRQPAVRAKSPRLKRRIILPVALRSPYVMRVVSLRDECDMSEGTLARCMFCGVGKKWEVLFSNNGGISVMRGPFESMIPGVTLHVNVISAWAVVLNYEEKMRKMGTTPKLFCNAGMLLEKDFQMSEEHRITEFTRNMNAVLAGTEPKSFKGFQMVFVPILARDHYYLLLFNLSTTQILIIDNMEGDAGLERYHGNVEKMISTFCRYLSQIQPGVAEKLRTTEPVRLKFPWQTLYNVIDCGIFLMRHMETYNGTSVKEWTCGFSAERNIKGEVLGNQAKEIEDLRKKYISKMLLSDVNTARVDVEREVKEFAYLDEDERVKLEEDAAERICQRLDGTP
ncbi:putative nodulin homeobox protein [Helianthus annuus]|nr:putative nodulin homeobox protein [Helianthus annuus]